MLPGCKTFPLFILLLELDAGCSSLWAGGPQLQAQQPGQSSGLALTMTGTSRKHSPGQVGWILWLKSALETTGNAHKHRGKGVFQEYFQAKFSPCLRLHTPFLFVLLSRGWLPAEWRSQPSSLKIPTQLSVGSYSSFIFLLVSSPGRHRTTHLKKAASLGIWCFYCCLLSPKKCHERALISLLKGSHSPPLRVQRGLRHGAICSQHNYSLLRPQRPWGSWHFSLPGEG